jgi:uncharacterized surface protein with fasciclin (FAS1) repeats
LHSHSFPPHAFAAPCVLACTLLLLAAAAPAAAQPTLDIVATAQSVPQLSSLVTALTTANLVAPLQAPTGPFTVFAPVNSAFSKLPPGLLTSVAKLTATLKLHVVPGRLYAADVIGVAASATPFLTTLNGDALSVTFVGGTVYLNGYAAITTPDVDTSNGVGESPPVAAHSRCALVRARREEERKRYRL